MKKWICVLTAAILACLPLTASLAEDAAKAAETFTHIWADVADETDALEIEFEDGEWQIFHTRFAGGEIYSVSFENCFYDEEGKALICEGGTLERIIITEPENWDFDPDEVADENESELIADQFGAVLTVDADGLLHWTGSGDVVGDHVYVNWDERDDGLFVGEWQCSGTAIEIRLHQNEYEVIVYRNVSRGEKLRCFYTCTLDETGTLTGTGRKIVENAAEDGEMSVTETVDGCEAAFALDGDTLIWNDIRENAGGEMAFTREVPEDWEEEEK